MARYKPYEKYKDSGVEWIGQVPEHWTIHPVKRLLRSGRDGIRIGPFGSSLKLEEMDESYPYKVYGQENVITGDFLRGTRFISKGKFSEMEDYGLEPGDIIISMMGTIGRCKVVPDGIQSGIMDSHLIRIRVEPSIVNPQFLEYVVDQAYYLQEQLVVASKGSIMSGLNSSTVKTVFVAVPTVEEQQTIINFLDHKTSEIDNLIVDKEKLITLLQEYRQSVISEAVTKGLNPDVKMKDSGIEWIGEIPEHWEVTPLFTTLLKRKTINKGLTESNVLSLSYGRIITRDVSTNTGLLPESFETYQIVEPNNLVLRLTDLQNDWTSLRCGLVTQKGIITSAYLALTPLDAIMPEYAYYLLHAYDLLKVFYGMGGGVRQSLNFVDLKWMPLLLPPIEEQHSIIKHLNSKLQLINQTIQSLADANVQLKTYRQSLISEVVTGKIDVREFEVKGVDTSA